MASGDFSPHRAIEIRFTSVVRDGGSIAIETIAKNETPRPKRAVAPNTEADDGDAGKVASAKREVKGQASAVVASVKQQINTTISEVKDPGRTDRAKQWAINKLPYRPQVLHKGTVYDAELADVNGLRQGSAASARSRGNIAGARLDPERSSAQDARFWRDATRFSDRGDRERAGLC